MFQVSPWTSSKEAAPIDFSSIPLWAHLTGLPLDLRILEGLSFAAGLIGEPKETDEFTRNITDVNLAHVKVEADLISPLPDLIELKRTSGEIFQVSVHILGSLQPALIVANLVTFRRIASLPHKKTSQPKTQTAPSSSTEPTHETPPVIPSPQEQNTPVIPESDFETDLMEILSPVQTALPHATIEPRHTITLASPSPSPDFDEPHTIVFTSQPAEAPVVVALSAQTPRRATPFKHKVTHKKLFASHQ
ncbi:hypothetical protein DY000_02061919 [Brassica cretica]|uniref:DUF4283 domain-containing protein n=1 Tax=Brassica cretica TaxID=69181 RepID=A0ABQ7AVH1_BRACR|nr:hypothetical protein DY000_02061919 [Brassica cretica]